MRSADLWRPADAPRARTLVLAALMSVAAVAIISVAVAVSGGAPDTPRAAAPAPPRCSPPFRSGAWPDACWRPFGASSPFNQQLPADPRIARNSAAVVRWLTAQGGPGPLRLGTADKPSDWDHPVYWSHRSDPVYRLHCSERSWGRCPVEGARVRVPAAARPAGGGDHHLAVIDPAGRWEYDLWKVEHKSRRGGVLVARWGGRTRFGPRGTGLNGGATAAEYALLAGIIRAPELEEGHIDHALSVLVSCDNGRAVYPASGLGAKCAGRAAAPPMGARFQLAMSDAEIDALPVPAWERPILTAMAHFGFFVGDTGGSPWELMLESGSTYTSFGYPDPWVHFAQLVGAGRGPDGVYNVAIAPGVDWRGRLRMIDPCVTRRTCLAGRTRAGGSPGVR